MRGIMVDIQSPTTEIRRGKKRRRKKKKETTGQKYNGLPYYTGRPQKFGQWTDGGGSGLKFFKIFLF